MNHPELDIQAIIRQLEDTRAVLIDDSLQSKESRATVMLDQQSVGRLSRMDALQGQAMAQAGEDRRQLLLRRIEAALARIGREPIALVHSPGRASPSVGQRPLTADTDER